MTVEVRSGIVDVGEAWHDLVGRAEPNVFMDPTATGAAHRAGLARIHTLLAWDAGAGPAKLVGLWTLSERAMSFLGPSYLAAPQHDFAFVGNPVIDVDWIETVTPAFLTAIAEHPHLPKVVRIAHLDGDTATCAALARAAGGRPSVVLSEHPRAFMTREGGVKRSGATRKKLRQDWNRLSAEGELAVVNRRDSDTAEADFETFLAMEQQSWKGANGTALGSRERDARYARALFADLAQRHAASVAFLTLAGKPIACQVLLYSGTRAYTWKTAYDATYARHSPGALLIDRVTEMLLDAGFASIESCSPAKSFMSRLWPDRRRTIDMVVDLGGRRSPAFVLMVAGARAYARAKAIRDQLAATRQPARKQPPQPAT